MPSRKRFHLLACLALLGGSALPAHADEYVGYRRIGEWNLAKKTSPEGRRIEMMAVASKETDGDFFLIMCAITEPRLYVSIVTKDKGLVGTEEPLRLKVRYAFDDAASDYEMRKVLVDDQAVLRDDDRADIEAIMSGFSAAQTMQITAGPLSRSYDLGGFAQAFAIVDGACKAAAP